MENDQEYLRRIRDAYPGTCSWLLSDMTFQEWFEHRENNLTGSNLLWLNGKPGSGKTVLASFVVEEARKLESNPTVLFFYFKKEDDDRNSFLSMARTLLSQILEQNHYTLDYFYSKCCSSGGAVLSSRLLVEELLSFALRNCQSAYIVLDGLDECSTRKERGEIASWFRDLIENGPSEASNGLHCMFISQHDSARKDYRDLPSITTDAGNNEEDIETFCKVQAERLVAKLQIAQNEAHEIAERVSSAAEGIFLFARSVWTNLLEQSSISEIERAMRTFATDSNSLDDAYSQIMRTIMDKPLVAQRDEALQLLSWLVCAKRVLKMHEVQTMRSVDFEKRAVEFEQRQLRVHPKDLCESLVDVREDGSIELVHRTAKVYLANSGILDIITGELQMATLCIDYLNLPSFQNPTEQHVLAGEFGFMEYAVLYWLRHLETGMSSAPPDQKDIYQNLTESLNILVEQYWNEPTVSGATISKSASRRTRDVLHCFSDHQSFPKIQLALILTDKELKHFRDVRPEESALRIADVVEAVRRCIEEYVVHSSDPDVAGALRDMYGSNLFKCPRLSCMYFTNGFSTMEEREKHFERHERPARCTDEHCRGSQIGFATQAQLDRHLKENHPDMMGRHHNIPTDEEVIESMREASPKLEPPFAHELKRHYEFPTDEKVNVSMWEALLKTEVPIKNEPQHEENHFGKWKASPDLKIAIDYEHKRRKVKQEYRCVHCDKTFTKKYNLESHERTHGVNQRLQCHYCDRTCARKSDLARHIRLHDPDSAVTCGGVLPNGRRWGCGTDFARLDVLRTHHKSKKGRQCIAERDSEEAITASTHMKPDNPDSGPKNASLAATEYKADESPTRARHQDDSISITEKKMISPIVCAMLDTRRTRGSPVARVERLSFDIDWDPRRFLDEQEYDATVSTALERAITITGNYENAQALTCMEYMTKVWPKTGRDMIFALQAAMTQYSKEESSYHTSLDSTELTISFRPSTVLVQAHGDREALTELCEQLTWLASTFRMAPTFNEPCLVCPEIQKRSVQTDEGPPSLWLILSFTLLPALHEVIDERDSGHCWHKLFRNPTIVQGFPIEARQHGERGLEISLDVLYTLAETRYATRFENTLLLKGHCTLLVPTQHIGSSFVWHLICSEDGKRIPYYSFRERCSDSLDLEDLDVEQIDAEDIRHFVGWTSHVNRYLGAGTVAYNEISYAGQEPCKSGLAFEQKVTISVSRIVGVSGSVVRGNRDKPEYFKYSALRQQLESARAWFIVLYDPSTRRGWLTDGTSALLHMVRTQLARRPYDGCGADFTNKHVKTLDFSHPHPDGGPDAVFDTLMNEDNQKYVVSRDFDSWSEEKVEPSRSQVLSAEAGITATSPAEAPIDGRKEVYKTTCFKQIVTQAYSVLEVIYDREREMASSHAVKELRLPMRESLEGWEFMDFVSYKQTLTRRYLRLRSRGLAWVDMVQRAHGLVLFGENFGDLYGPARCAEQQVCRMWKTVPQGHELLTAPVSLIQQMQQISFEDGEVKQGSNEIVKDIFWYPSTDMLGQCMPACRHTSLERVQQLSRKCMTKFVQPKLKDLSDKGAVIFGGSDMFHGQPIDDSATQSLPIRDLNSTTEPSPNLSLSAASVTESDSVSQSSQIVSNSSTTPPELRRATESQSHDEANRDGILTSSAQSHGDRVPTKKRKRKHEKGHQMQEGIRSIRKRITQRRHNGETMPR
ncbi:unnamed protein product [Alternaria alternata]